MVKKFLLTVLLTLEPNALFLVRLFVPWWLDPSTTVANSRSPGYSAHSNNLASAINGNSMPAHEKGCLLMNGWRESLGPWRVEEERGDGTYES